MNDIIIQEEITNLTDSSNSLKNRKSIKTTIPQEELVKNNLINGNYEKQVTISISDLDRLIDDIPKFK